MKTQVILEIFGYIGSALVVVSMLMSSLVKLRIINTVGSLISGIYAVLCGAIPLAVMNACLITINGVNLIRVLRSEKVYEVVSGCGAEPMTAWFLEHYGEDIKTYFPDYDAEAARSLTAYTVLCDGETAGVMLAKENGAELGIMIDYSTPRYRDCSVGRNLYAYLEKNGIRRLVFVGRPSDEHVSYMNKVGFALDNGKYIKG